MSEKFETKQKNGIGLEKGTKGTRVPTFTGFWVVRSKALSRRVFGNN